MDRRIAGLARKFGFAYTRYADDFCFSGDSEKQAHCLRLAVQRVVREEGFEVNAEKTRLMRRGGAQVITGVTVNSELGLSRKKRRIIRAMIHRASLGNATDKQKERIAGQLAWVHMLNPAQADALRRTTTTGK
jgi:hypothetical protein